MDRRFETDRLVLRRWRVSEAAIQRELWLERDDRIPPHRRIDSEGHPSVHDLEQRIRDEVRSPVLGLLALERKQEGDVIGYCGLLDSDKGAAGEPEIAFELLTRSRGQGYATEAARAVLEWAADAGHVRVWATVRAWNHASLHVLAKLDFDDTGRVEPDEVYGDTLYLAKRL